MVNLLYTLKRHAWKETTHLVEITYLAVTCGNYMTVTDKE